MNTDELFTLVSQQSKAEYMERDDIISYLGQLGIDVEHSIKFDLIVLDESLSMTQFVVPINDTDADFFYVDEEGCFATYKGLPKAIRELIGIYSSLKLTH